MLSSPTSVGISIRNILLPTDFSHSSEEALVYGASMARRFHANLNIVTVVPEQIVDYVQPPDPFYLRHCAQKKMTFLSNQEVLQGLAHREFVKDGQISETIPMLIDQLDADLVVLGVHNKSRVKQLLAGSTAEEIINSSICSVIAIGPSAEKTQALEWRLRRILYATDLSPASAEALKFVLWLGEQDHAHLTLLYVRKRAMVSDLQKSDRENLMHCLEQLLPPDSSVMTELIVDAGDPAQQILKVANTHDVDLIVMGPRDVSATWTSTHLPWMTCHNVLCHSHCPVLTVHHRHRKPIERYC